MRVRWSEVVGRKIIDTADGRCLGDLADVDLILDDDGRVLALRVRVQGRWGRKRSYVDIPWQAVQHIGADVCLLDRRRIRSGEHRDPNQPLNDPRMDENQGGFTGAQPDA